MYLLSSEDASGQEQHGVQDLVVREKVAGMIGYFQQSGKTLLEQEPKLYLSNLLDVGKMAQANEIEDAPRGVLLRYLTGHCVDFTLNYWRVNVKEYAFLANLLGVVASTAAGLTKTSENVNFVLSEGWSRSIRSYVQLYPQRKIEDSVKFPAERIVTKAVMQQSEALARKAHVACKALIEREQHPEVLGHMSSLNNVLTLIVGGMTNSQ